MAKRKKANDFDKFINDGLEGMRITPPPEPAKAPEALVQPDSAEANKSKR